MSNTVFTKALCAAAAVTLTMTGFSASASAEDRIVRTAVVEYGDLDLTSADGKATLDARMKGAVRKVCGGFDSRNLVDVRDHSNCVDNATTTAKRATVTLLAAAEAGEPIETAMVLSN